jgi:hypothetical protein
MRRPVAFVPAALVVLVVTAGLVRATTFDPEQPIPLPVGMSSSSGFDLASAGLEACLVWQGQLDGGYFQPAHVGITGNGLASTPSPVPFPDSIARSLRVRVAALSPGRYAFAWQGDTETIWLAVLDGDSWGTASPIFTSLPDPTAGFDIAAAGDSIYIAWVEANAFNGTLVVSRVSALNLRSQAESRVDDHLTAQKVAPRLAVRGGEAYVAWSRFASDPFESAVFAAHGPVNGTWTSPGSVTRNTNRPFELRPEVLVAPNGTMSVAWEDHAPVRDGTGPVAEYLALADPSGDRFGAPVDLGAAVGSASFSEPALAFDPAGRLRMAWLDADPATQAPAARVMYAESEGPWVGSTSSFLPSVQTNTDASAAGREQPVIGFVGDRVLVAWGDRRGDSLPVPYVAIETGSSALQSPGEPAPWLPTAFTLASVGAGIGIGVGAYFVETRLRRGGRRGTG